MTAANRIELPPVSSVQGSVVLPGSKSISNRVLLMSALADGPVTLTNLLYSDDVRYMLAALGELGVDIQKIGASEYKVPGSLLPSKDKKYELYLGNAGTAMRSLCAVLSAIDGQYILKGNERMCERPIFHLVDALSSIGCDIKYSANDGYPPLLISGKRPTGGEVEIDGSISSQYLTALLIMAPLADKSMTIKVTGELVSKPYIDITTHLMEKFSIKVENNNYKEFFVKGGQQYTSPGTIEVESDASSASYFMAAAAIKGKIRINSLGSSSIQGDIKFAQVMEKIGAKVTMGDNFIEVEQGDLKGVDLDLNHIPDAAMTLATTALFAKGTTTIKGIGNWRVKETDRIHAMATELQKLGADIVEGEDFISITPPSKLQNAVIDTYDDHRMAMCFSLASLGMPALQSMTRGAAAKHFPIILRFSGLCVSSLLNKPSIREGTKPTKPKSIMRW